MTEILYVYGTLRPGTGETCLVPGSLFDLGWFPGIRLTACNKVERRFSCDFCGYPLSEAAACGDHLGPCSAELGPQVVCEKVEIEDWVPVDRYEGYRPERPDTSLYIRRPHKDGWIYEYNQDLAGRLVVDSGDWLKYMGEKQGENGWRFRKSLLTSGKET